MSALYMSISANERDLEIEDDLAKGRMRKIYYLDISLTRT